jgi:hypothetical protein
MTRKDFVLIAATLRTVRPKEEDLSEREQWAGTVRAFADSLATTNARFNRERFCKACGV